MVTGAIITSKRSIILLERTTSTVIINSQERIEFGLVPSAIENKGQKNVEGYTPNGIKNQEDRRRNNVELNRETVSAHLVNDVNQQRVLS